MSFRLSAGTLDSMGSVFAPAKKYRLGSGGGSGKESNAGGTMLGMAVASMFSKPGSKPSGYRPGSQTKRAFGGGSHAAVSQRAITTMERTARRVPEVMVRITGRQHGGGHVLANFSYIARLGHGADEELGLYTSDGDIIRDGGEMQILAQDWHEWEMDGDARRKGATSLSMILSMPTGTDPERLKNAALDFAREEFANRSWVASLHVDRDHPHIHLTIARRDHDGRRFHPNRDDLFRYRQRFAEKLRDHGIEANATPAKARGIDPKHEPIAARKVRETGRVPRIDISRAGRVEQFRERGISDPVGTLLATRQATVRTAFERSITELSSSPNSDDREVAKSLERFVATMPTPEPNSVRAMRSVSSGRGADASLSATSGREANAPAASDPLSAAIARSREMRERIEVDQQPAGTPAGLQAERVLTRPTGISDRLRSLMEQAKKQSADTTPSEADEILREMREHAPERSAGNSDRLRSPVDEPDTPTKDKTASPDGPQQERDEERPSGVSDRLRSLMEEASKQSASPVPSRADEILREMRERDRQQPERDRSLDRGGPRR